MGICYCEKNWQKEKCQEYTIIKNPGWKPTPGDGNVLSWNYQVVRQRTSITHHEYTKFLEEG